MKIDPRWIAAVSIAMAGCGAPASPGSGPDPTAMLRDVGDAYKLYIVGNKKPPAKADDLVRMQSAAGPGVGAVKSGLVVVRYGAMMADTNEGPSSTPSDEVLAYEKQVPESGGKVLMLDRSVRTMTADEFKAAKKAGKN